jgi:iron complex outermembrane receptor protein
MPNSACARSGACVFAALAAAAVTPVTTFADELEKPAQVTAPKVTVTGTEITQTTAGPVEGYRALTTRSSTKTETPIEEIPQSIQVIPRSLIDDQQAVTASEVLRNVSSVEPPNPLNFNGLSTTVRGFQAEYFLDGLSNYYNAGDRDSLVNIERIEVLKGPTALMYGGGVGAPIGGMINVVSKMPKATPLASFGSTFGSYNYVAPYFDLNQPLTEEGTVLLRATAEYGNADSFIDVINTERYSINPTLTFTNNSTTALTLQGRFSSWRQQDYTGLPVLGTVAPAPFKINPDYFVGNPDVPKANSSIDSVTAFLDHRFDEVWSTRIGVRSSWTNLYEPAQFFFSIVPVFGSTFGLWNGLLNQDVQEINVNPNLVARFNAGSTANTWLLGFEYNRTTDTGFLDADPVAFVDVTNPQPPAYTRPTTRFQDADNTYQTLGGYTQIQSTLWNRLHLLAGVRVANIRIENTDTAIAVSNTSDSTKVLPRVGAVFDIVNGVSVYGSYSQGFRGLPFALNIIAPQPEDSEQFELGVKLGLDFGLSGTLALFDLKRNNVSTPDPLDPFRNVQTGEQKVRGFEADLIWQPTRNWSVLASYAYLDSELTRDNFFQVGNQLVAVPKHSGRLWGRYTFGPDSTLAGLFVGAGLYATTEQAIDLSNTFFTPGYCTLDAAAGYAIGPLRLGLTVKNITDKEYFVPYTYLGNRVAPGAPRTVYGTVSFLF